MDKIKFITLENDKFSMAINYTDIVAIHKQNEGSIEVLLDSSFITGNNKQKILSLDYSYEQISKDFENDDNFVKKGEIIINKYYDDCLISPSTFPSESKNNYFQFNDITSVIVKDSLDVKKVKRMIINFASTKEAYVNTLLSKRGELTCIYDQLELRDDFIKLEQENNIIYLNVNSIISCIKVKKNIYILTFESKNNKIELKYNTESEAELVHSVIMGSLDFKENDEIEKNVSCSYEYDTINKLNMF